MRGSQFIQRRTKADTAIHNLLDVFVAANNLDIVEAQRKYQRQLAELDRQIEDAKFDVDTVYPCVGGSLIVEQRHLTVA